MNKESLDKTVKTIIDHLNVVTGKKYKYHTPKTRTLIKARLAEGFAVEDFIEVINKKWDKWKDAHSSQGQSMRDFMRPMTLFGTKFEGYLNEEWNTYDEHKGWRL